MSKIRILFLSHRFYPFVGGIEVNSEILAGHFVEAGHDVKMATWTKEKGSRQFNFEIYRAPSVLELIKLHYWADLVFENNPCYRLAWPMIFMRTKSIIAIRTRINRPNGEMGFQDRLKMKHLKKADGVIAVSSAIQNEFWKEAKTIPNPYRHKLFKNQGNEQRKKDFVFLGRLVSQKRCNLAIELIKRLNDTKTGNYNLTIIGEGPEMEDLKLLSENEKVENQIFFLGQLSGQELVDELNKHKFIVIPSEWEAFGNVALEGMACGNIPIVSNSGGLVDAIGNAGVTFESGSIDDLVSVTKRVLHNIDEQEELLSLQQDHLNSHQPQKIASRYLNVIENQFIGT